MSFQQYNIYAGLTPVRLVSTSNISGTYFNGPLNNGVDATLTIAASSLTVDSVVCAVGDRLLLQTQTNTNEQGIYVVNSIGSTVVLQRSADQQSIEQIKEGQYVSVAAGSVNAGNFYTIVEPLPAHLGIDALVYNADPSAGGVSFSGGPSVANAIPVFSDTSGNIKPQSTTATLGFGLTVQTGNFAVSQGNVAAGSSGHAGTVTSFPGTAANGTLVLAAVNNSSNHSLTISNSGAVAQDTVLKIADPGVASSFIDQSQSSATSLTNKIFVKTIVASAAALATSGHVAVMAHPSATSQFKVMNIRVMYTASGLSGGGGDRLLTLTDGTIVFNQAGITAAVLGTPVYTLWGGTGNPLPGSVSTISTAGADIYLVYSGGTTDFTTGSVTIEVELAQVTA